VLRALAGKAAKSRQREGDVIAGDPVRFAQCRVTLAGTFAGIVPLQKM
jgi:hypothetical protein